MSSVPVALAMRLHRGGAGREATTKKRVLDPCPPRKALPQAREFRMARTRPVGRVLLGETHKACLTLSEPTRKSVVDFSEVASFSRSLKGLFVVQGFRVAGWFSE